MPNADVDMVLTHIEKVFDTFVIWPDPFASELSGIENPRSKLGGLIFTSFHIWDSILFQKNGGSKTTMTKELLLPSFELPGLSLSTVDPDTSRCQLSESAPDTVIDNTVVMEVWLRTLKELRYFTTEMFLTFGQIIEPKHTIRDVNASHAVIIRASIEKTGYNYGHKLLSVTLLSAASNDAEPLDTIVDGGFNNKVLEKLSLVSLEDGRQSYAALQQLSADLLAASTRFSRLRAALLSNTFFAAATPRETIFQNFIAKKISGIVFTNRFFAKECAAYCPTALRLRKRMW